MAVAVASVASTVPSSSSSVVITAPSGIVEGDLLVMIACAALTSTLTPPAGWTEAYSYSSTTGNDAYAKVWYKIALAADEVAANYTVTVGTEDCGGGVIFRITGGATGNPFYKEENAQGVAVTANGSYSETSLTLNRPTAQIHILFGFGVNEDDTGYFTSANYSITSADANPTWTEVIDARADTNVSTTPAEATFAVAYATSTDTSTITALGFDYTAVGGPTIRAIFGYLMICTPQAATGTNVLLEASPVFLSQAGVAGTLGTNALLEVSPTIPTQSGKGTTPTQWTEPTIEATDWTNEEI